MTAALQRGQHVAERTRPHDPIGVVVRTEDGLVTVRAYASGWELDVWRASDLVRVSEWRLIPRDGLSPAEREAIAGCPWCDTLGLVDHGAADAAVTFTPRPSAQPASCASPFTPTR
ncbi:hypothetical protein [Mycobacterium lacus]|uniref:hypothetical protein n=1 Tax=Mycobacterium lacus TaxID=169765 RepID=UPI00111C164F|nr:hypothetical protein [Mycobacterium lacus]MCV7122303.1 hypothetical protein [Mycobacterium lacus]